MPFQGSFMASDDGCCRLPIKAKLLGQINKRAGAEVTIELLERPS